MDEDKIKPGQQLTLAQINRIRKQRQAFGRAEGEPETHANRAPDRGDLDVALSLLSDGHSDPDYVVSAMRSHFGDLFTDDDEATVRELVKAPAGKPSDGLKVDEIKAALAEKGIAIPEGVTLKADLAELLDNAEA